MPVILEICAASYNSALAAAAGGADRIEICSGLSEGGLTPSYGLLKSVLKIPNLKKHVLIRPRGGDFLYTAEEVQIMAEDIRIAKQLGADGVVIGALTQNGDVDKEVVGLLMDNAKGMNVTFHRAFDLCRCPLKAIEDIISLGCNSILTSGQASTAEKGIELLKEMVDVADHRISIMAGSGVNTNNISKIIKETGVSEIHASAKGVVHSKMKYKHPGVTMGNADADEYTCIETIQETVELLKSQV